MIIWFTPRQTTMHPPKMDVLPKTFVQINCAATWLARHSSTSPKLQQRPLPSLLSVSSSLGQILSSLQFQTKQNHCLQRQLKKHAKYLESYRIIVMLNICIQSGFFLHQILAVFIFNFSSLLVCFLCYFPVYVYHRLDRDYLPIILFQQRIISIACYLTVLFSSSLFTAQ